jgi:2-isopropylmalate synthase
MADAPFVDLPLPHVPEGVRLVLLPLTGVPRDKFELTRGVLATFMSSDQAERGFCRDCGTPLTFRYVGRVRIAVSIGSLDEPAKGETGEAGRHRGAACRGSPGFRALPGDLTHRGGRAGERPRHRQIQPPASRPRHDRVAAESVNAMSKERLYLFDTTLRDGAQTNGVDFTLEDKIQVAGMLDRLGIDYVEGGYPGANPTDDAFFESARTERAVFTAFGMTKRPASACRTTRACAHSSTPRRRDLLRRQDLGLSRARRAPDDEEENLEGIRQSVTAAREAGKEVLLDCEHFFDGYKANPDYALACAKAAYDAGARWVVLCDTNGGTLPEEVEAIVARSRRPSPATTSASTPTTTPSRRWPIRFAAVRAGARQIQGTLNGIGERCGNANLTSIIPTLMLKPAYADRFETGVAEELLDDTHAVTPLRRAGQPGSQPAGALCRRLGLHHQGRHPRLGDRSRIRRPTSTSSRRRSATAASAGFRSGRQGEPARRTGAAGHRSREGTTAGSTRCSRGQGARGDRLRLRRRRRVVRTARPARLGEVPDYFDVESFHVTVERRTTRSASSSRSGGRGEAQDGRRRAAD